MRVATRTLWVVNLAGASLVAIAAALAMFQPLFGFSALLAGLSYVILAALISAVVSVVRGSELSRLSQVSIWIIAFLLSGILYALFSAALGVAIGQPTGLQFYPVIWLYTAPAAAVYVLLSVWFSRNKRLNTTLA